MKMLCETNVLSVHFFFLPNVNNTKNNKKDKHLIISSYEINIYLEILALYKYIFKMPKRPYMISKLGLRFDT